MTFTKELGLTRSKYDRTQSNQGVFRVSRSIGSITNAYQTYLSVPIGYVALIDEISVVHTMAGAASATETVFLEFTNFEDQSNVYLTGGDQGAGTAPAGVTSVEGLETQVITELPLYFTKSATAGEVRTERYSWKLNGDLCLTSGSYDGSTGMRQSLQVGKIAGIRVKNSTNSTTDSVHIQYRLMTKQQAMTNGEFKNSWVRAVTQPVSTSSADVINGKRFHSIEIMAIAVTGNAKTTATTEDVRMRFSDNLTVAPSVNRIFWRAISRNLTVVSASNDHKTFLSGMHIRGPSDYRVTSLGSTNVGSTMSIGLVGQYVKGRDETDLPHLGLNADQAVANASGTSTGGGAANELPDTNKTWGVNAYKFAFVKITGGLGAGQIRLVLSNTATVLTTTANWGTTPDATSTYLIYTFKPRHETWEPTGTSYGSIAAPTNPNQDQTGNERGGRYFWCYSEGTGIGDEQIFTINAATQQDVDMDVKVRGYHISAIASTSPMAQVIAFSTAQAGSAGAFTLTELFWIGYTGANANISRDDLIVPAHTFGHGAANDGSGRDDATRNVCMSRALNNATASGWTTWGTLDSQRISLPVRDQGVTATNATSSPGYIIGGLRDFYTGA